MRVASMNKKILPSLTDHLPHVAYDAVIFGFSGSQLKILLLEYHNTGLFALPGGFVSRGEDLDLSVSRGVQARTGLDKLFLEQFYTFGDVGRASPGHMKRILEANGYVVEQGHWLLDRFISIAYYALINYDDVKPEPDSLSDSINWYAVGELPQLMMDHTKIVDVALRSLRLHLDTHLAGRNLLPRKFTMRQLQQVYEVILGEKLRRTTFQRKILGLDILERHEKQFTGKPHKAPYLYSFKSHATDYLSI